MDTSSLPTKNNLIRLQGKIKLSKQGHELLEKKKFILKLEKDKYKKEKEELQKQMNIIFNEAYDKFKNASVDIGIDELMNISEEIKLDDSINIKYKSIMGVEIPSVIYEKKDVKLQYGLYNTTIAVDETIISFNKIKQYVIRLAELDNIIFRLDLAITKVQTRSNALSDIIIPNDEKVVNEIKDILEEREREEFSRLKVVKKRR